MKRHKEQIIHFSEKYIEALWLTDIEEYKIEDRTIVINLGTHAATVSAPPDKQLQPRCSTILKGVRIKNADSLLLIKIIDETNIGGIVLDPNWHQLGEISDYPKDVPLWKSPQFDLGTVRFDPFHATGGSDKGHTNQHKHYQLKVNLWFAPAKTNCAIHNHHATPEFLEVHTQVYGIGRMQKFHTDHFDSLYQDVIMSPGETHLPFASVDHHGEFFYPWHQYYSDTDCIWIANEFHPID